MLRPSQDNRRMAAVPLLRSPKVGDYWQKNHCIPPLRVLQFQVQEDNPRDTVEFPGAGPAVATERGDGGSMTFARSGEAPSALLFGYE